MQKYVKPHLTPPSATAYEEDRNALTAQFDAAEAMLKEIQTETNAVRLAVEEQREKIVNTTQEVENVVQEMRKNEGETHNALREMRDEVQTIKDMLPKVCYAAYLVDMRFTFLGWALLDDRQEQGNTYTVSC